MPAGALATLGSPFFKRLVTLVAVLALLPVAATVVWSFLLLREEARAAAETRLRAEAILAREPALPLFRRGDAAALDALAKRFASLPTRFTFIDGEGRVLGDSEADPRTMESHAERPEVRGARDRGDGVGVRRSGTTGQDTVYVAVRADPQDPAAGTIRAALPTPAIEGRLRDAYLRVALFATPVGVVALVSAAFGLAVLARAVHDLTAAARAVAQGGPPVRAEAEDRDDEVGDLARAVRAMGEELERRVATIGRERNELATIVRGIGEGLIAIDAEARVLLLNPAAERLLALGKAPAPGTPLVDAIAQADVVRLARETARGGAEGALRIELFPVPGKDPLAVEARATPFGEDPARPDGAVVLLRDVTEAERYERLRREFVANVSHELRTPLALVKGFLETLEDGAWKDPEHGPRFLSILRRHVDGLERLVADLLTLSLIESGAERRDPEAVPVAEAIDAVLVPFRDLVQKRRITLERKVDADLPPVGAQRAHVERVVRNLVDNAVKFSGEGGRIEVAARRASGGEAVEIIVTDDGPGIPLQDQPRIFERFYRVEKARTRGAGGAGGTGLGLAIVKHTVQQAGGSVSLASEPGKGAAFTVALPLFVGNQEGVGG